MPSVVKVTRKGQVTIPKDLRASLGIEIGDTLVVREEGGRIILEKPGFPSPGEPVGVEEYRRILEELEKVREAWR